MNRLFSTIVALIVVTQSSTSIKNEIGNPRTSPKGTYKISEIRDKINFDEHRLLIQKNGSSEKYLLFKFNRFITWSFSADERFIIMNDALGSGECDVQIFEKIDFKPFYKKIDTVDEKAWKAFMAKNDVPVWLFKKKFPSIAERYPSIISEDHHNYTCGVKWLSTNKLLVYLLGNGGIYTETNGESIGGWDLGPGYFFVYDCIAQQVIETELTKSLNKKASYTVYKR